MMRGSDVNREPRFGTAKLKRLSTSHRVVFACCGVLSRSRNIVYTCTVIHLGFISGEPTPWKHAPNFTHHLWITYRYRLGVDLPGSVTLVSQQLDLGGEDWAAGRTPDWLASKIGVYLIAEVIPNAEFVEYIRLAYIKTSRVIWCMDDGRDRKFSIHTLSDEERRIVVAALDEEKHWARRRAVWFATFIDAKLRQLTDG